MKNQNKKFDNTWLLVVIILVAGLVVGDIFLCLDNPISVDAGVSVFAYQLLAFVIGCIVALLWIDDND